MSTREWFQGLPVIDATEDMELQCHPSDQISGVPFDAHNCAVAVSCRRMFHDAVVYQTRAYIRLAHDSPAWVKFVFPTATQRLMKEFDVDPAQIKRSAKSAFSAPVKVQLRVPPPSLRVGARAGSSGTNKRSGNGRKPTTMRLTDMTKTIKPKN